MTPSDIVLLRRSFFTHERSTELDPFFQSQKGVAIVDVSSRTIFFLYSLCVGALGGFPNWDEGGREKLINDDGDDDDGDDDDGDDDDGDDDDGVVVCEYSAAETTHVRGVNRVGIDCWKVVRPSRSFRKKRLDLDSSWLHNKVS